MRPSRLFFCHLFAACAAISLPVHAGTTIDLGADASRPAPNDLARSIIFSEASGASASDVAQQVKKQLAEGLRLARAATLVKTNTGSTNTYPNYGRNGKIDGWRMRSEIVLESTDAAALSELVGQLQGKGFGVASLTLLPQPETRKKVEAEAILDALDAFRSRAKLTADALGKPYRIVRLSVSTNGRQIAPMLRAGGFAAEASMAMPVENGDTQINASVSGQIELAD